MFRSFVSASLAVAMLLGLPQFTRGEVKAGGEVSSVGKIRSGIASLGLGPDARIEVTLRDRTKIKGFLAEASDNHFTVIDEKTRAATKIAYSQVDKVKGHNLTTRTTIILFAVIMAAILTAIVLSVPE